MSTDSPRKIIPKSTILQSPEPDRLIADILNIFQNEITQIADRSRRGIAAGKSLEASDARILQGYAKMLVELSKEDRERRKSDDLKDMPEAEFLQLATEFLAKQGKVDGK
jgi:hypothetical protein